MRNLKKFLALVLAVMMVMGLMVTANAAEAPKVKLDGVNSAYKGAADVLSLLGLVKGDEGTGDFRPNDPITKAEFAMMIYRLCTGDVEGTGADFYADYATFTDLTPGAWYVGPIGFVETMEYMIGSGTGGVFNPKKNITGYEVEKTLLAVLGYGKEDEFLGAKYTLNAETLATQLELNVEVKAQGAAMNKALTRQEVAQLVYKTLFAPTITWSKATGYNYADSTGANPEGNGVSLAESLLSIEPDEGTDEFGNPVTIYKMKDGTVLTSVAEDTLAGSWTGKQKTGNAIAALKAKGVTKFYEDAEVLINGDNSNAGSDTLTAAKANNSLAAVDVKFSTTDTTEPWYGMTLLDYYTSVDNNTVEVYVNNSKQITRVIVKNTFVDVLGEGDVIEAKGTTKAAIRLAGVTNPYEYPEGEEYAVGDVILYNKGIDPDDQVSVVAANVRHADSFEGTLDGYVRNIDTNVVTYTIDGKKYTVSEAKGNGGTTLGDVSDLVGEKTTWYYLNDNGTWYLVGVDGVEEETPDAPTAKPFEGNYIMVLANGSAKVWEGNYLITTEDDINYAEVYGVLEDGSVDTILVHLTDELLESLGIELVQSEAEGVAPDPVRNQLGGLYSYTESEEIEGLYELTPVVGATPTSDIGVGQTKNGSVILTGETQFWFIKTVSGTNMTVSGTPTLKVGNKAIGDKITRTNAFVVVDDYNVARYVFVLSAVPTAAKDSTSTQGTLYYLTGNGQEVVSLGSDGKKTTEWGYEAIDVDGNVDYLTVDGADAKTTLAAGVYEMDKDGKLAPVANANKGAGLVTDIVNGTSVAIGGTYLNRSDAKVVAAGEDVSEAELALGQDVVYVKGDTTLTGNDIIAVWILDNAETTQVTITATDENGTAKTNINPGKVTVAVGAAINNEVTIAIGGLTKNASYTVTATGTGVSGTLVGSAKTDAKGTLTITLQVTVTNVADEEAGVALAVTLTGSTESMPKIKGDVSVPAGGKLENVKEIAEGANVTVTDPSDIEMDPEFNPAEGKQKEAVKVEPADKENGLAGEDGLQGSDVSSWLGDQISDNIIYSMGEEDLFGKDNKAEKDDHNWFYNGKDSEGAISDEPLPDNAAIVVKFKNTTGEQVSNATIVITDENGNKVWEDTEEFTVANNAGGTFFLNLIFPDIDDVGDGGGTLYAKFAKNGRYTITIGSASKTVFKGSFVSLVDTNNSWFTEHKTAA